MFVGGLFLIAVAVWCVPLFERARLPVLGAIVLAVGTVFGPAFFAIDGILQVSLERILFAIVCVVAFFSLRGSTAGIPKPLPIDWMVATYALWVLISALRYEAPHDSSPLGTWIFYILMPAVLYGILRVAKLRDSDIFRTESILLGLGLYLAVTGFFECRGWYSLVFPRFIADPTNWEFLGRARGPLLNPSANGIVLTIALAISAVRLLRAWRDDQALPTTRAEQLGYSISTLVLMLGIYSTLTRSVWIGAIIAIVVVFWQVTPRWTKVLGLCSAILLAGFVAAGLKDQLLRMKRDKNLSAAEAEKSVQLRPLLAIVAYEMIKDAPLTGHGFGHYFQASKKYYSLRDYGLPLEITRKYHQHNVVLTVAVNNGLIGLSMFIVMLVTWIRMGWRLSKSTNSSPIRRDAGIAGVAGIAGYLVGGMFQDVTIMPMINMYLFYLAGTLVTLSQIPHPARAGLRGQESMVQSTRRAVLVIDS
jgi:O-antigen ligase